MKKILIISSNYYPQISNKLETGAKKKLSNYNVKLIRVPGVFEIPVIIAKNIKKYDGFVALGCVVKGETSHFDLITKSVTNGIMQLSILNKKPIGNGILSCFNMNQVNSRTDKGIEAAKAVIEVLKNVAIK